MPTPSWERSRPIRRSNKSSIFPDDGCRRPQLFVASFERKTERPQMSLLLGWEYGREWLKERDEFLRHDTFKSNKRFIEPDYNWWLKKRQIVLDRRKLFTRSRRAAANQKKCYEMTAFDGARQLRQERELQQQHPERAIHLEVKCECADCKQKRCRHALPQQAQV